MYIVGYEDRALVSPPELQGNKNWEDQVGTGPFMFKEYVAGSYMTYEKNPIWWQTEVIDGVEYELPFADEMTIPIIPEEATTISALRTGKFDWIERVEVTWWDDLDRTAPEMDSRRTIAPGGYIAHFMTTTPPFDNVNVRRAMSIGTDAERFIDLLGVDMDLPADWYPFYPLDSSVYTPMEELPEDIKVLYEYDPELAKKMLADEGYPNGFKIELNSRPEAIYQDIASMLKDQWSKIGVDAEIQVFDAATTWERALGKKWKHSGTGLWESADAVSTLLREFETGTDLNYCNYSDPEVDALINQIKQERDVDERIRLALEAYDIVRYDAVAIGLAPSVIGHFWWPWIKNYYGEANVGDWGNPMPILAHVWIDQNLKAEMGY
jgi:peptide/nickel transport system substrate-binding protein